MYVFIGCIGPTVCPFWNILWIYSGYMLLDIGYM